uniref:Uncharacterized protein n=1 Tax=uncultured marine virus TaxID=186617 RepID=A0A0F7L5P7_9VIRU|nr:hypothetical protein [uncultured marine virus]
MRRKPPCLGLCPSSRFHSQAQEWSRCHRVLLRCRKRSHRLRWCCRHPATTALYPARE